MRNENDTPEIAKRREREMRTISQMIVIYCEAHHGREVRTDTAHCGEKLCSECKAVDDYATLRTLRCKKMDVKTSCEECGNHCYKPDMRERIRAIMRFAGPRMITRHPVAAIRHLVKKVRPSLIPQLRG